MVQLTSAQRLHCQQVIEVLQKNQEMIQPILRAPYLGTTPYWFDFTEKYAAVCAINLEDPQELTDYIQQTLGQTWALFGIGRYNEDRVIYRQSTLFNTDNVEPRSVHLAFDLWLPPGTPLYTPLPATIESAQDNNHFLDYGNTIILKHRLDNVTFYSLYGHLSQTSIADKVIGESIAAGELFAWIGQQTENGQWAPHVHAQIICDLLGWTGDFPGVARVSERDDYTTISPDPSLLFHF